MIFTLFFLLLDGIHVPFLKHQRWYHFLDGWLMLPKWTMHSQHVAGMLMNKMKGIIFRNNRFLFPANFTFLSLKTVSPIIRIECSEEAASRVTNPHCSLLRRPNKIIAVHWSKCDFGPCLHVCLVKLFIKTITVGITAVVMGIPI